MAASTAGLALGWNTSERRRWLRLPVDRRSLWTAWRGRIDVAPLVGRWAVVFLDEVEVAVDLPGVFGLGAPVVVRCGWTDVSPPGSPEAAWRAGLLQDLLKRSARIACDSTATAREVGRLGFDLRTTTVVAPALPMVPPAVPAGPVGASPRLFVGSELGPEGVRELGALGLDVQRAPGFDDPRWPSLVGFGDVYVSGMAATGMDPMIGVAMALGAVAVVPRFEQVAELVIDGRTGVTYDPAVPGDVLTVTQALAADCARRHEIAARSRDHVLRQCHPDRHAAAMADLIAATLRTVTVVGRAPKGAT